MKILERNGKETARSYALRVLLYNIVNSELVPGEAVSENDLASALNLSRTPVREALIELGHMGLVDIIPQKGSFISKIDLKVIDESRFIRQALENAALDIICEDCPAEYPIRMRSCIEEQRLYMGSDDYDKLMELDNSFHRLIFEAADKLLAYNVVRSQMVHFDRLRTLTLRTSDRERIVKDHEDILYAVERRDPELARMLMSRHLERHKFDTEALLKLHPDWF